MLTFSRLRSLQGLQNLVCSVSPLYPSRSYSSSLFGRIGFVGLGNMGSRMADSLIKAGYEVAVHDINHDVMKMFSDKGILTEDSPLKVAETSDVVITMLPSSNHVLDVYTGQNGFLSGFNPLRPWLFIDSSTIDPQTSRKVSAAVSNCSLIDKKDGRKPPAMLDAPVSGGVLAAENGTLTFMTAKICNNLAMAIGMLGVSEAFALGQSLGIAASTLTKIFNSSSARCWSSDTYNPVPGIMDGVPSSRNYIGGFASKLMAKDLNLAAASAKDIGFKCPLTSQAEKIFTELCNNGHEAKDFSGVFRYYYSGKEEQ
ncbi:probable 3-hydroxyisobutyrate dehydrogenase, mitochondrial isoform X7 [Capsicum annuum]|uniref:probable 3-hydroxyisobutyrate dehydrogenase, mitochondrial isoform X7 n=1 Tax=Capsicum annuum TaxID=4072 RepID=UPI001FB0B2B6|nr:probable 3-hydroxyisobutyrate dehydrogenase, mitochondrial isoform X7 [Capsicum annuum]